LFPWYLGIGIIAVFEAIIAYLFFSASAPCGSPVRMWPPGLEINAAQQRRQG
jgi:hypothetical protein